MSETKTYVFPENSGNGGGIDPALLVALNQNGGFGGGAGWMWPMFMYMMFPWLFAGGGFGGFGGFGGGFAGNALGTGYLANQLNNDSNVNTLLQALNGRYDAMNQLAQILNTNVSNVQNGINAMNTAIATLSGNIGLTGQQIISQILSGNASLSQQLCQCCCDNHLAIVEQTNQLGSQADRNFGALQLQLANAEANERYGMCQQSNQLSSQADRNTQSIKDQIAGLQVNITKEFCDIRERELQDKLDASKAENVILRGQIDNAAQTDQFNRGFAVLNEKISQLAAKQPNTVPVQWPNIQAVNTTPNYPGGYYPYPSGYPNPGFWGQTNFWN